MDSRRSLRRSGLRERYGHEQYRMRQRWRISPGRVVPDPQAIDGHACATVAGISVVAAVSMMFGLLLTAAVFLPGPIFVVAGLLGVSTAVVAACRDRASALVRTAAALSASG
jgi:hypothetical protein